MKELLKYAIFTLVIAFGVSAAAKPSPPPPQHPMRPEKHVAPEVDASLAIVGLSLLAGTVTVLRARSRK
jgi:hypothetical protein